jgi:hypothetical protein
MAGRAMHKEGEPGRLLLLLLLSFLLLHPAAPSHLLKERAATGCLRMGELPFPRFPAAQCGALIPHPQNPLASGWFLAGSSLSTTQYGCAYLPPTFLPANHGCSGPLRRQPVLFKAPRHPMA